MQQITVSNVNKTYVWTAEITYHTRVKGTRSHELSGTDKIPKVTSATNISESTEAYICKEHERKLDFFYKTHKVELCLACRRIEHNECSRVVAIRQAAQEIFSTTHGIKFLKSLKDLTDGFADCKAAAKTIKDKLPGKKARAVESVKHARKVADQYLDKIEADAYHELDVIYEAETTSLEEKIHICAASESFLQKRVNRLEKILSIGEKEKEFIEINKATKKTKQYCITLRELYQEVFEKQLTFQHNSNLTKLNEWLNDLGQCCQDKSSVATPFRGPVAIYTSEIKVKTKTDKDEPVISSYNELPDGRKLLVDWKNKKVKMFDAQNYFISEIVRKDEIPWNLVLFSSTEAVVSSMNGALHYLKISDVLKWTRTKTVPLEVPYFVNRNDAERLCQSVLGIDRLGADMIALLVNDSNEVFLRKLDNTGYEKRTFCEYKEETSGKPCFVVVSENQKSVFVLSLDKGCIGYSLEDGSAVFRYKDAKVQQYYGLAVGNDCTYIGIETGESIGTQMLRLGFSGKVETLTFSNSRPMKVAQNEIVLFTVENNGDRVINFCSLMR